MQSLGVWELAQRELGCGLWTGWFVYRRHTCKGVICYPYELASPGRGGLSRIKAPNARVSRTQKIRKYSR